MRAAYQQRYTVALRKSVEAMAGSKRLSVHGDFLARDADGVTLTYAKDDEEYWIPIDMVGYIFDKGEAQ